MASVKKVGIFLFVKDSKKTQIRRFVGSLPKSFPKIFHKLRPR